MLMRIVIFLAIAVLLFLPVNWLSVRQLLRIHPRRKRWIVAAAVAGNLMWLFFPMLRSFTPFSRVVRATLGPLWFGWTSFAVLYSGFVVLVLLAWLPFRGRKTFHEFARQPSRAFLLALIVGFVIGFYQAIVPLRIEHVPVGIANLPPSLEGTRLVLLGDLHVGLFTRPSRLRAIFEKSSALTPDAVIIAGDLIDDDPHFVPKLLESASVIDRAIPLFAVLGNHEMYGDPYAVIDQLRGSRIRLLANEGVALGDLWVAGITDPARGIEKDESLKPDLARALALKAPNALAVVISHQPRVITDARRLGVPLALCAHTHGGQLGFRPLRLSLAGLFLPYHMGLYDVPPTQLYVNTGTGYWLWPFRLGMTPEITLIELRREPV